MKELKRGVVALSLAVPFLAAACATTEITRIADPIGPSQAAPSSLDEGRLVVHTELRPDARVGDEGYASSTQATRQAYTVYDLYGRAVRSVAETSADLSPETVTLPAGDYLVRAKGL